MGTVKSWALIQAESLAEAHHLVERAFNEQLKPWWVYIPPFGFRRIIARDKLLRVGQYICDQMMALTDGGAR